MMTETLSILQHLRQQPFDMGLKHALVIRTGDTAFDLESPLPALGVDNGQLAICDHGFYRIKIGRQLKWINIRFNNPRSLKIPLIAAVLVGQLTANDAIRPNNSDDKDWHFNPLQGCV